MWECVFFPPGLKGLGPFGQDERGAGSHDGRQKGVTLGQVEKSSEGKERKQNEQNQETIVEIKLFFALLFFFRQINGGIGHSKVPSRSEKSVSV